MRCGERCDLDGVETGALSIFAVLAMACMMVVVGAMFTLAARHHMMHRVAISNVIYKEKAADMVLMTALELEDQRSAHGQVDQAILDTKEEDGIRYRRAYTYQRAASCLYHGGAIEQQCTIVVAVEQKTARDKWVPRVRSVGVFRVDDDDKMQLDHWEP